ncbi:uncharacterized protein Z520_01394 [Fonsecaea multimorphosa CBS 102226]|uniref:Heterokaryon incompatibility domain-containing protein n=1 Tax=Fonsecaea multimorphosa CBS 102226 TaxID=1442371 RepID=A0A0D2L1M9_9EURO|nr:uncharacterized protein Z520_01394 [Fonsecaea multimorphosa CBS 102226]KIY02929.1 hypothetical protein Z520_01394 [Fonsecaea multimorphosa CBS 102226]OAL30763.1 hypothetical protein AYO22_01383 [Fonsecaea multimorphosa]
MSSQRAFPNVVVKADPALCEDCQLLFKDIISGPDLLDSRWETVQSDHNTLTHLKTHLDNYLDSLRRSAKGGCGLCKILTQELGAGVGTASTSTYSIFFWGTIPQRCEFKVALGTASHFVRHIKEWEHRPVSILFFRKNGIYDSPSIPSNVQTARHSALHVLPDPDPGSEAAFQRAKHWLDNCMNRHERCARAPSSLPKRVVDLGTSEDLSSIKLYVTQREPAPYMTISYKWGEDHPLRTRNSNLEQRCEGIPLEAFPRTLRDGVVIAKTLGFRYIWIDSLCIIQGNKLDWHQQSGEMTAIYGKSLLNISASSAESNRAGILRTRPEQKLRVGFWFHSHSDGHYETIYGGGPNKTLDLEKKEISERGWVFQERLVSPATLHYTDEGMLWECVSGLFLEHHQNVSQVKWKEDWKIAIDGGHALVPQPSIGKGKRKTKDPHRSWKDWLCAYSERNLYEFEDKFPAMAGVAKTFATTFGLRYAAGLWRENMVSGLMWRRFNRTSSLIRFKGRYIAPSWSPFSVKGRLEYRHVDLFASEAGPVLDIIKVMVEEEDPGSCGQVMGGEIVAKGLLQPVVLDRNLHPYVRKRDFQECGVVEGFKNCVNVYCMLDEYDDKTSDPLYHCWCLRLGSFDSDDLVADMFLLLKEEDLSKHIFRRVGLAETDARTDVKNVTRQSGLLSQPVFTEVTLL